MFDHLNCSTPSSVQGTAWLVPNRETHATHPNAFGQQHLMMGAYMQYSNKQTGL
jgi:hypothetical protein